MRSEGIAILEGHGTWSANEETAGPRNVTHIAQLLTACSPVSLVSSPLDARDSRVIVWLGPGSNPEDADAAESILEAVRAGSSLFVTLDGASSAQTVATLLGAAGMTAGDRPVRVPDPAAPFRTTDAFVAATTDHDAVADLGDALVFGALPIEPGDKGEPLIMNGTEHALAATAPIDDGRVVVVGDSDMFGRPFVARENNADLLVATVAWLLGTAAPSSEDVDAELRSIASTPRSRPAPDLLARPGDHAIDCTPFHAELKEIASGSFPDPYLELEQFLEAGELVFHQMPEALRKTVLRFRRDSNDVGALLVRGLPGDPELPPTPSDARRVSEKATHLSELWTAAIGTALGDPVSFGPLKEGEIFMNICPTARNEVSLSSESSKATLDYHTELAYHPYGPTHLLLLCLRPDHERVAKTFFSSSRQVVGRLSPDALAALFSPEFRAEVDLSFRGSANGGLAAGIPLPVLYGDPYDPMMNFDGDLIAGTSDRARRAYRELTEALLETQLHVELDRGDLLILDNRRATHGRSQFVPRYDGRDRWLQRMYIGDLRTSVVDRKPGSRVIETEFAA